jgi:hypothetical protein
MPDKSCTQVADRGDSVCETVVALVTAITLLQGKSFSPRRPLSSQLTSLYEGGGDECRIVFATHLLRVEAPEAWWKSLTKLIQALLDTGSV